MTPDAGASDEKAEDERRSSNAGLYLYSRLAASILTLLTLALAARLYERGPVAAALRNGMLDAFAGVPERLALAERTYQGDITFAFVATILLIYDTAYALGSLGLPEAVFYFVGRDRERAPLVVRQASFLLLLTAIPVVAIVIGAGFSLSDPEVDLLPALPWLVISLLFAMPTQPVINQLLAIERARGASIMQTLYAALNAIAFVGPGLVGISVTWVPILLAGATSVRFFIHLWLMRTVFPRTTPTPWLVKPELVEMMRYAAPAGLASLCGKLNPQIDKYVVKILLTTQIFNFYTAASWELPLVNMIPYAIGAVMQVRYVELYATGRTQELHDLWWKNVTKTSLAVFPITAVVLVIAPELIELVVGPKLAQATLPFMLFSIVLFHRVASYGSMLQATNQTPALLVSSILLVSTNAILTLPLTYLIGYPGAALATVLANVPPWLWVLRRIGRAMGVGLGRALPWLRLARGLAVALAVAAVVWLIKEAIPLPTLPRLVVAIVLYGVIYIPVARTLRILGAEDIEYITRWLSFRLK